MFFGGGGVGRIVNGFFDCCRVPSSGPTHQWIESSVPTYLIKTEVEHVLHALRLHLVEQAASNRHGAVDLRATGVVELDAVVAQRDDVVAAACVFLGVCVSRKVVG